MSDHRQVIRRIITCQGSIQLVTALSVLRYREKQQNFNHTYENYLVIYDLNTPEKQIEEFAAFIKKMAEKLLDWQSITYISPEKLKNISDKLTSTRPAKLYQIVHSLVGTELTEEIYLCRNWQFGNQLFINAYQSAEKICYGDSIGIYFSSNAAAFFAAPTEEPEKQQLSLPTLIFNWIRSCKNQVKTLIEGWKEQLKLKTVLATIEFDRGYFVLPEIMGEVPPMPTVKLDKTYILENFQRLRSLANPNYVAQTKEKIAGFLVVILLTSNLSEACRMSVDDEITAYREFLIAQGIEDTVLVIKPHPRDDITKIERLKLSLTDLFIHILVLWEPELFFLPFEVFFLEAFLSEQKILNNSMKVLAVSSACISLKLLFNVPSIVGFGDKITSNLFYENYIAGRLAHEHELRTAVENLNTRNPVS